LPRKNVIAYFCLFFIDQHKKFHNIDYSTATPAATATAATTAAAATAAATTTATPGDNVFTTFFFVTDAPQ
jgi:hypothetical protein